MGQSHGGVIHEKHPEYRRRPARRMVAWAPIRSRRGGREVAHGDGPTMQRIQPTPELSGFVITPSPLHRPPQSFRQKVLDYYARRFKRLVHALIFCIVVTSVLTCLFDPSPSISLQTGLAGLVGASNLDLYSQSTDYFTPTTELNTFTQTWSLGVEEQFY